MKQFFFFFIVVVGANTYGNATREDWKVFPMTDLKVRIPLELIYTKKEFGLISEGFIPRDMDDRWVIVAEDEHIFIYRSSTGVMIYDCLFEKRGDEMYVSSMYANRNSHEYSNTDDENDIHAVKYLLGWLVSRNSQ